MFYASSEERDILYQMKSNQSYSRFKNRLQKTKWTVNVITEMRTCRHVLEIVSDNEIHFAFRLPTIFTWLKNSFLPIPVEIDKIFAIVSVLYASLASRFLALSLTNWKMMSVLNSKPIHDPWLALCTPPKVLSTLYPRTMNAGWWQEGEGVEGGGFKADMKS